MTRDPTTESLIDNLANEFMRRYRDGDRPTVAEYLKRCPDLAEQIRDLFPALIMLENLAKPGDQGPQYSLLAGLKRPDVLGDYRILQEIGRGGMGIVYEAEQISLGRHVAIKVLPFQLVSDQSAVDRFHREARAAARLQHPNIVPVYDFCQGDSVWYYAMQFIHGQSLEEVLSELQRLRDGAGDSTAVDQLLDLATSLISNDTWGYDQAENLEDSALDDSPRQDRIGEVIDAALQKLAVGERVSEEELYAEYPELMPELKEQYRILQLIEASRPPTMVDELDELGLRMQSEEAPTQEVGEDPFPAVSSSAQKLTGLRDAKARPEFHEYFKNVARLMLQVARALEYAHQEGVIHRDVKPSNLLLDTRGQIWITDFGLAKLSRGDITSTGSFAGTLRYMAPEQIRGKFDCRTDVYSLGITLYEMLSLQAAFQGTDYLGMMKQICEEGPVAPRDVHPAIPRDLETIVLRAIDRDCDTRYESAQALADDLERFIEHREIRATRGRTFKRVAQGLTRRSVVWTALAVALTAILVWRLEFQAPPVTPNLAYILALTQAETAIQNERFEQAKAILEPYRNRPSFEVGVLLRRCQPDLRVFDQLTIGEGPVTQLIVEGTRIYAIADGVPVHFDHHDKIIQRGHEPWADQVFRSPEGPGWFGHRGGSLAWAWQVDGPRTCPLGDDQYDSAHAVISPDGQWICTADRRDQLRLWRYSAQDLKFNAVDYDLPASGKFRFAPVAEDQSPQLIIRANSRVTVVTVAPRMEEFVFAPRPICFGMIGDPPKLLAAEGQQIHLLSPRGISSDSIRVWDNGSVRTLYTLANGETIVAGLAYGHVGLWHRPSAQQMLMLNDAGETIRSIAASATEELLVAGGQHGTVYWWDATPPEEP